jgi:DNA-binding MarR family transcriptional regulator
MRRSTRVTTPRPNLGLLISLANVRTFSAATTALSEHGMTPRGYSVLELLQSGPRSQRDLAHLLQLDPSRIVALVDQLENAGLVERRPHPDDRRVRQVETTPAGEAAYTVAREATESTLDAALHALSPRERETLAGLLERIVRPVEPA